MTFGKDGFTTCSRALEKGDEFLSSSFRDGSFDFVERVSKLLQRSFQFFGVCEEDIVPHLRRRGCDAREVSKASGRELGEFALAVRTFQRSKHERVGDRVRQVRGERENRVVSVGRKNHDARTDSLPQRLDKTHAAGSRAFGRSEDGVSVVEEVRSRVFGAGTFGACDGMGRNAHGVRRQQLRKLLANAVFDRSDIADDGVRGERGGDGFENIGVGTERRGENEQVGGAGGVKQ